MYVRNEDRYKTRRTANRILNFIWWLFIRVGVALIAILAIKLCIPWLKALWETIT